MKKTIEERLIAGWGVIAALLGIALMFIAGMLVGCDTPVADHGDQAIAERQAKITAEADAQIGLPGIQKFTEKRLLRMLYEKRDQEHLLSYSYTMDLNGQLHHICDSIGYPFPYATQFTAPEKETWIYQGGAGHWQKLPQAEPNGLFMPPGADGTWVQCIGPTGSVEPRYVEPHVITSLTKLRAVDSYQVK